MMFTWIRRFLTPPVFENEDKTRVAGLLNVILPAVFVSALILTLLSGLLGATASQNLVNGAVTALLALVMWFIMRRGYVQLVSLLLSLILLVNGTIAVYFAGTIRAPIATVYILCIVIAGLLISSRAAVVFNLLSLLALLGLLQFDTAGLLPPVQVSVGTTQWVTYTATFSVTTVLLSLAIRSINEALERARRNERALAESNRELEAEITERKRAEEALRQYREHLEDLVAERTSELQQEITERKRAEEEINKRTAELKRMLNLMSGREVRMAELKDVIRQLRAQLEEAGLTPVADDPLEAR